jgi:2-polyprenyl-6-methoxyphenol hydroxylase-like FAD-dependent oxidoreductase
MQLRKDVVIVGGGIAGGAIAATLARAGVDVAVVEFQEVYRDLVRGEAFSPWGVAEVHRMGISDLLYAAEPSLMHTWVQWDEIYAPSAAPSVDLLQGFVRGVRGPLAIHHQRTCQELVFGALEAGAEVFLGAHDVVVRAGTAPSVSFTTGEVAWSIDAGIVVGAAGRHGAVGKQVGLELQRSVHHWGGGLAVEGLDDWPEGVQAIGTEDDRMFFVFPQKHGRARLYLNFPPENARRYAGPEGTARFLADFDLRCVPYSDCLLASRPVGRCMTAPSLTTWMRRPETDGVVLIGDEAGANDPVLGTGLANSMRDARIVSELLMGSSTWQSSAFDPYVEERRERMRRLHFAAGFMMRLSTEFGPDERERRRRAWERMRQNPNYMITLLVAMAGPDQVPDWAYSDFLVERLLAPGSDASLEDAAGAGRVAEQRGWPARDGWRSSSDRAMQEAIP